MKESITVFLQQKLDKEVYLFRVSMYVHELQSDVTLGTIIADFSNLKTHANLCKDRIPDFFTDSDLALLKAECLAEAANIEKFMRKPLSVNL